MGGGGGGGLGLNFQGLIKNNIEFSGGDQARKNHMEFPGVLVLGLKSFEGCTRVIDFCGVSGVKLFFLEFPGIK